MGDHGGLGDMRESVTSKITMGVMNTAGRDYQYPSYNLELLEAGIKRALSPSENLMDTIKDYTGLLCVAILIGWIVQFAVTISILLWTLIKEGFRTKTTVCCTGPHLIWCAPQKMRCSNLRRAAEMEMES